jgi:hypothetical protein
MNSPARGYTCAMSPYSRRPNYDRKLSRALVLADGRRLVTLRAAAHVISDVLASANSPSHTPEHAIALLLKAANSCARGDVAEATNWNSRFRSVELPSSFQWFLSRHTIK